MRNNNTPAWRKEKRRIQKLIDKWFVPLGLGWWHVHIDFVDGPSSVKDDGFQELANCAARWPYRKARVEFFPIATMDLDDEALEEVVVHEFCHILVNQMREKGIANEESVVTSLAKAFVWTYWAGRKTLVRPPKQQPARRRKGK